MIDNLKAKSLQLSVESINLDYSNPRITGVKFENELGLLEYMYDHYSLDELALSMRQFGYFNAEPIVVIPEKLPDNLSELSSQELDISKEYIDYIEKKDTKFIVVEGNRRVSTIKLLLNISGYKDKINPRKEIFNLELSNDIKIDLKTVPAIVYPSRKAIIPYLGVRHIGGNKSWEPYPQALYIANLIEKEGYSFSDVKDLMSDKSGKVIKNFLSLKLLEKAEQLGLDGSQAKNFFSFITLSIGQKPVKEYIGLPVDLNSLEQESNIIKDENIENFKRYFIWVFGDKKAGKQPIIGESRDITGKLTKILGNITATKNLEKLNDLEGAYELSDGEKDMVLTGLSSAHRKLVNLKDTLAFLLSKGIIVAEEVEKDIFSLNSVSNELNNTLNKYRKDV